MKTLLITADSSFVHANLAVWYIKAACKELGEKVEILDLNINLPEEIALKQIFRESTDIIAFSCYIWNKTYCLSIANSLKKINPNIITIFAGPEPSFCADEFINSGVVDIVISGEGEESFPKVLSAIKNNTDLSSITGVSVKGNIYKGEYPVVKNLANLPMPYTDEMLERNSGKIIYYESSRGCPFNCAYCLSSSCGGVRFLPIERVKNDLKRLCDFGLTMIKFVDRTFNCNPKRTSEILNFIIAETGDTLFHFEIAADIITKELLNIFKNAPKGKFQLEIGVQSTNEETLTEVNRKTDVSLVLRNAKGICENQNIHTHLDLIAGLPLEDFDSFKKSFNDIFSVRPHNLQLGFLKLLHGSELREKALQNGSVYRETPPYEVLFTNDISATELFILKDVEETVERYYNKSRFCTTLEYILEVAIFNTPFDFFYQLSQYLNQKQMLDTSVSPAKHFKSLDDFMHNIFDNKQLIHFRECLRFDWARCGFIGEIPDIPPEIPYPANFKNACRNYLINFGATIFDNEVLTLRELSKRANFVLAHNSVWIVDRSNKDKVNGLYKIINTNMCIEQFLNIEVKNN